MPAVFLQVADELGGAVGLDERGSLLEKPAPCLVFFVLLHSTVVIVTTVERWPQAINPHLAAVLRISVSMGGNQEETPSS